MAETHAARAAGCAAARRRALMMERLGAPLGAAAWPTLAPSGNE
jgi:hypothetical protein